MTNHLFYWSIHHLQQLYSKLMPIPCRLCGCDCQDVPICSACMQDFILLGPSCPRCALPVSGSQLCGHCLQSPPEQQLSFSLFIYQPPISQLIQQLKYNHAVYLCQFFAKLMADKLQKKPLPELLIAMPLHPNRLRHRGYNQSLELVKTLSKHLSIPFRNDVLIKIIDTPSQSSLPHKLRKKNIAHSIKLNSCDLPQHIALVDDVMTTGHTANTAVQCLHQGGATKVEVWTIARTIKH